MHFTALAGPPNQKGTKRLDRSLRIMIAGWLALGSPAWSKTEAVRPVPEYAPTPAVMLSADLFAASYHAPELMQAIVKADAAVVLATTAPQNRRQLAGALLAQGVDRATVARSFSMYIPHGNIWLRDYGPIMLSTVGSRSEMELASFRYDDPSAQVNNQFSQTLAGAAQLSILAMPLVLDGGNLLVGGEYCFTSTQERQITNRDEIEAHFARLGCRKTVVISEAPHAHLDMWMKIVSDQVALVNQVDDAAMAAAKQFYGYIPDEVLRLKQLLDIKADELSRYLRIIRVPMPLPYRGVFRTYTNSVLVNGHAIVPSYRRFGWNYDSYPDARLLAGFENKVKKIYEKVGYRVSAIAADGLIFNGGAFHCVTLPLPFTGGISSPQSSTRKGN